MLSDVVSPSSYLTFNIKVAQVIGLLNAVYCAELLDIYSWLFVGIGGTYMLKKTEKCFPTKTKQGHGYSCFVHKILKTTVLITKTMVLFL